MTDFYQELNLDPSLDAEALKRELSRLESVWKRRELTSPEKATRMMTVILDARSAFQDDVTRANYDRELAASRQAPAEEDPNADRAAAYRKWLDEAARYQRSGESDLAQMAIEKAVGFMDPAHEDPAAFLLAATVNRNAGNQSAAFQYVNRAIVLNPADPAPYVEKGLILDSRRLEEAKRSNGDAEAIRSLTEAARSAFSLAEKKARAAGRNEELAHALGGLAWSYCNLPPVDKGLAKTCAEEGRQLGDSWNNCSAVLETLKKQDADDAARAETDRRRREDAEREAEARRAKLAADEQQRGARQAALSEKNRKAKTLCTIGWIGVGLSCVLLFLTSRNAFSLFLRILAVFASAAVLNYGDAYKNGYSSRFVTIVSLILGISFCFTAATNAYGIMGYSASSAAQTWKYFIIMLVIYFALILAGKGLGKSADKKTRF